MKNDTVNLWTVRSKFYTVCDCVNWLYNCTGEIDSIGERKRKHIKILIVIISGCGIIGGYFICILQHFCDEHILY